MGAIVVSASVLGGAEASARLLFDRPGVLLGCHPLEPTMADSMGKGGTGSTPPSRAPSPDALARACREIVDAASALMVDVEFLVEAPNAEKKAAAAEDALRSVKRIVQVAEALRNGRYPS
jgi:hypothetical protein